MKAHGLPRRAEIERSTTETKIHVDLVLDGNGQGKVATTIPFLDHMLTLFSKHGFFDLTVRATGDTDIDEHHTVEDIGIVLGTGAEGGIGKEGGDQAFRVRIGSAGRNPGTGHDRFKRPSLPRVSGRPSGSQNQDIRSGTVRRFFPSLCHSRRRSICTSICCMAAIHTTSWKPSSKRSPRRWIKQRPLMNESPVCCRPKASCNLS